jgi:hypothetical protein
VALVRADVSEELSAYARCEISSQLVSVASYGYVPSSPIIVTLTMEALSSSETSVLTRATRRNIPEDAILQKYRCSLHINSWFLLFNSQHISTHKGHHQVAMRNTHLLTDYINYNDSVEFLSYATNFTLDMQLI